MKRWLYAHRAVLGDPEMVETALRSSLPALLAAALEQDAPARAVDASFVLPLPVRIGPLSPTKSVRMHAGVATRRERRTIVPLRWRAEPGHVAFPAFDGAIEIERLGRGSSQLSLVGSYTTPFGVVGAAIDAVGLGQLARQLADTLVDGLADELRRAAGHASGEQPFGPREVSAPLRVLDVMTSEPLTLTEDMPVRTAALLLFHYGVSGAPVIAADGSLVGLLSEADLLDKDALPARGIGPSAFASDRKRDAVLVGDACTRPARVTHPEATVQEAAREMLDRKVARLVVVDEGRVAGIVSRHDLLAALLRDDRVIEAAVQSALAELDELDVHAAVRWGVVELAGRARRRSAIPAVFDRVRAIDGVVAVEGELEWSDDDLVVIPPTPAI